MSPFYIPICLYNCENQRKHRNSLREQNSEFLNLAVYVVTAVLQRVQGKCVTYVLPSATAGQPHVFVDRWQELSHRLVLPSACLDVETSELLIRETGKLNWNVILLVLTFRVLMSYIYGAPILDVSRSHTTTQHSR